MRVNAIIDLCQGQFSKVYGQLIGDLEIYH
jgi:hypothetical protein